MNKIEIFYDSIDKISMILYNELKMPYIEAIIESASLINSNYVKELEISTGSKGSITKTINKLYNIDFEKEEIRKALQLVFLKAFKHEKIKNSEMTPDTIGLIMGYLVKIIFEGKKELTIMDPLVGTSNLLSAVANFINLKKVNLIGVENNYLLYQIARAFLTLEDYNDEHIYYQDTLTFKNVLCDLIICDIPFNGDIRYNVVSHHMNNLKENGYFLAIIPNDYFEFEESKTLRSNLKETSILGLIKLPDNLFKEKGKSILILRKKNEQIKEFLMCDLPNIDDKKRFIDTINKIELWFNEYNKGE